MENLLVAQPISEYREFSRSLIRSEILLLEQQGPRVHRRALLACDADCQDNQDQPEQCLTRYIPNTGAMPTKRLTYLKFVSRRQKK